jgi:hypothetical protein
MEAILGETSEQGIQSIASRSIPGSVKKHAGLAKYRGNLLFHMCILLERMIGRSVLGRVPR